MMKKIEKSILVELANHSKQTLNTLAEKFDMSVPTITKIIKEMISRNLVVPYGIVDTNRGRRPTLYCANPDAFYFLGVDIRRYSLHMGIMNIIGEIVFEKNIDDFLYENTPEVLESLCRSIELFVDECQISRDKINLMNVNISGRVDTNKGYSHSIFNFEGNELPLSTIISQQTGITTTISNDTQAMTYGELAFGEGSNYSNFLFINAGWGIGLGIVIDKKVYGGKNGYAGEFGHINVYNNEVMCHCGKKGCLETEISGQALYRMLIKRVKDGDGSLLSEKVKSGERITLNDMVEAANNEDPLCLDIIEIVGKELGRQIANLINIFNPEAVIIGGNLARANEFLLEPIRAGVRKYSLKLINRDVKINTTVSPDRMGMLGACTVARQRLFDL